MSPRRIALFLPNLDGGGAERVMVNLARGLAQCGLAVDLVLVKAQGPYLCEVAPEVQIVDLKASHVSTSLLALIRYLRRARPAALLSTSAHANAVALLAKRMAGVKTRSVVRQAEPFSVATRRSYRGLGSVIPPLVRQVYRWADAVVAGSNGVAKDLALVTGVPIERIRVAPNPVVTDELFRMAREPVDHPWFTPGEDPVILSAGRLTRQKDFSVLIRAFARVYASRRCRLVVLGEGEERGSLEALLEELGLRQCTSLPGFVRNPFAYMRSAAVFVLSSAWEGLPGALIQALACGVPVVATDCESGPREILRDGRFGRLVPVGDVPALADAILGALDGPRPVVSEEAWSRYSQDAGVDAYLRILGEVAGFRGVWETSQTPPARPSVSQRS